MAVVLVGSVLELVLLLRLVLITPLRLVVAVLAAREHLVQKVRERAGLTPCFLQLPPRVVAVVESHQATAPTVALVVVAEEAQAVLLAEAATLHQLLHPKVATVVTEQATRLQILRLVVVVAVARQQLELMPAQA